MSNLINISIFEGGIQLAKYLNEHPHEKVDKAIQTLLNVYNYSYDYSGAKNLIEKLKKDYNYFLVEDGDYFEDHKRNLLYKLIQSLEPDWSHDLYKGLNHIKNILEDYEYGNDVLQVFQNSGLLDNLTEEANLWWVRVMQETRPSDWHLKEIGVNGEDQTIKYEKEKLNRLNISEDILNIAVLEPTAGYDIKSWRKKDGVVVPRLIESKKTEQNRFFLSRNEYETAKKNKENYRLYYWTPEKENQPTHKFTYEELKKNTPDDKGNGNWTKVEITV
jgi:hypothetical protein